MADDDMTWTQQAACRRCSIPQADWYAEPGTLEQRYAISVCFRVCPVRSQCLDHAIATEERHGVWGGLTVKQRQVVARGKGQFQFAELTLRNR